LGGRGPVVESCVPPFFWTGVFFFSLCVLTLARLWAPQFCLFVFFEKVRGLSKQGAGVGVGGLTFPLRFLLHDHGFCEILLLDSFRVLLVLVWWDWIFGSVSPGVLLTFFPQRGHPPNPLVPMGGFLFSRGGLVFTKSGGRTSSRLGGGCFVWLGGPRGGHNNTARSDSFSVRTHLRGFVNPGTTPGKKNPLIILQTHMLLGGGFKKGLPPTDFDGLFKLFRFFFFFLC